MHLRVERDTFSQFSTIGRLLIDGEFFCYTLEPVTSAEDIKPRAIPEGTYSLTNRYSPKHKRSVPHVENVPGFSEIEIHPGNFPHDTDGCCLVGRTKGPQPDFIGGSRLAFNDLWEKLVPVWDAGDTIDITYTNIKQGIQINNASGASVITA